MKEKMICRGDLFYYDLLLQSIILDFTYRKRTYRVLCVLFFVLKQEKIRLRYFDVD